MNHKNIFNITYLVPVFKDIAEAIYYGLAELGITTYIHQGAVIPEAINIIFGAHLIPDQKLIPADAIIFNLEQLESKSHYVNENYIECLRNHKVWDYSQRNINFLKNSNINTQAKIVPIGYTSKLLRIPKIEIQDIDILFYGALNDRRQLILDELRSKNLNVVTLVGVYDQELDTYISRSKVVLNLHFHETKIFEVVRVSYLLNNKKAVVSEVGVDTEIDPDLRKTILGVAYENLVPTCVALVKNDMERQGVEENSFQKFSTRSQALLLQEVVSNLIGPGCLNC